MWAGYAGTYFWVDPKEEIVGVYMTQAPSPIRAYYRRMSRRWSTSRSWMDVVALSSPRRARARAGRASPHGRPGLRPDDQTEKAIGRASL